MFAVLSAGDNLVIWRLTKPASEDRWMMTMTKTMMMTMTMIMTMTMPMVGWDPCWQFIPLKITLSFGGSPNQLLRIGG